LPVSLFYPGLLERRDRTVLQRRRLGAAAPASPLQAGHSILGRKVPWRLDGAQRCAWPGDGNGRPTSLPRWNCRMTVCSALAGAVANVELASAQALIGDVGCEKVGQGERRPQEGNGVMTPREPPRPLCTKPVGLDHGGDHDWASGNKLVQGRRDIVTPTGLIGERPLLQHGVGAESCRNADPKHFRLAYRRVELCFDVQEPNESDIDGQRGQDADRSSVVMCFA